MDNDQNFNPYAPPRLDLAPGPPRSGPPLASRLSRLLAHIIDTILTTAPFSITIVGILFEDETLLIISWIIAFLGVLGVITLQSYLITVSGQSLGKKALRIRIVQLDGSPPRFFRGVFLRWWVMWSAGHSLYFVGLIDTLFIFADDRRCLHDHMANTKVVVCDESYR